MRNIFLLLLVLAAMPVDAGKTRKVIANRKVEAIVVHHTAEPEGMTAKQLSDLEYWRLYAHKPGRKYDTVTRPRFDSGHYRTIDGERTPVFYSYQWIIRRNGKAERLLRDDEIGFHAGNLRWNEKAVAICFDGDYTDKVPSSQALATAKRLIAWYRRKFPRVQVLGHHDVKGTSECPGRAFRENGLDRLTR